MRLRLSSLILLAAVAAACSDRSGPLQPLSADVALSQASENAEVIPGRFIITVRDGVSPATVASAHGIRPDFVYTHALNGFAGSMSEAARDGLMRDARVSLVEPDGVVRASTIQAGATWGLDRIDQVNLPLSTTYSYTSTGAGVIAYIIDTGIRFDHTEFAGRASSGYDAVDGGSADDCNGHGTHVAGTVGGTTYGVAKGVSLVAVRVLDCGGSGSVSGVIAGLNWVAGTTGRPAVANMSLGGSASTSLDNALKAMIAAGVATAVAAGNGNFVGIAQDACKSSPARVPEAMTIGATDNTDKKASWSNYGNCVDWFAPGVSITSSWYTSTTATNTISGTSMATPHTTGVAALYLSSPGNGGKTPAQVRDALFAATTKGVVKNSKTTNNHLLFTSF